MSGSVKSDNLKGLRALQEMQPPHRIIRSHALFHRHDIENVESIEKLKHFVDAIMLGMLPDGEAMIYMANAIKEYLEGNEKTLDDAFLLSRIKGVGSAAKGYRKKLDLADKGVSIFLNKISNGISQEDAAIQTLESCGEDIDTYPALIRKQQRYKKNKTYKVQKPKKAKVAKKTKSDT